MFEVKNLAFTIKITINGYIICNLILYDISKYQYKTLQSF